MNGSNQVKRVSGNNLTYTVVSALTEMILGSGMNPGEKLPPMTCLRKQLGVSQAAMREAVKVLEARGLVQVMHGKGVIVSHCSSEALGASLRTVFRLAGSTPPDVMALRSILAADMAELAARHRTDEDLTDLALCAKESADRPTTDSGQNDRGGDFQHALARATHNPALISILEAVEELVPPNTESPRRNRQDYQAILDAVRRRDPVRARSAMQDQVERESFNRIRATPARGIPHHA